MFSCGIQHRTMLQQGILEQLPEEIELTTQNPIGPCMISNEGMCPSYFNYNVTSQPKHQ
ncbi:MAG: hypothetical protein KJ804_04005 [Proteobacteria bacterium]|nr:hypothetical protein [Pseudomonadota bacterium]MBU1057467.1 hypothetical protein [Pseudomonadota bacterium]